MSLQPFSNEELNFFKFASLVLNEFPRALRQIFVDMWDKRISPLHGYQPWDDSIAVRNMLHNKEGPKTKIPTNSSYKEWDSTALFQATLYARTFSLPDSKGNMKTLGELYLKNRKPVPGPFHSPVTSPSGDPNETIALAIDQLRHLRNTLCHSSNPRIDKVTFDQYFQYAKEAFTAVNFSTTSLEAIGNLAESDFRTSKVHELNEGIKKERDNSYEFLKSEVKDELNGINKKMDENKNKMDEIEKKMDELLVRQVSIDKTSAEELKTEPKVFNQPIDVLLLTTDDVEFSEAQKILTNPKSEDPGENQIQICFGEVGENKVALLKLSPIVTDVHRADALCAETIQKLKPKAIVGLGVCSGTKKNEQNLADILVSSQVNVYESSSKNPDRSTTSFAGSTFDCSLGLTRLFDCAKPGWNGPCPEVIVPKVNVGQIISAPHDIDNTTDKDELRNLYPEAIGLDIQNEGLYFMYENSGVPWVHCKTITNWVDGNKNSRWHTFGAAVSTSYVKHVLKKFYIPEEMQAFEKSLPKPFVPPMVPHFTGRQRECEEIVGHMTSKSTRLVTISGSPGFGKTSVAIAVGHRLKRQGLPVYFLSLRNVKSTIDLTTELLNSFSHTSSNIGEKAPSRSTHELCRVLSTIPSNVFIVLDNADNLFQGSGKTSQEILNLLEKIFLLCKNVTFLCTTIMSLEFLKMNFQGHKFINVAPLDNQSSSKLVQELLPQANEGERLRIAKICGRVPLAIKLLCGLVSEDEEKPAQFLDKFCRSSQNIIDLLDNSDAPSDLRLKILFESSFMRLSQKEQEAFISLSVFVGETFDQHAAVKVIGGVEEVTAKITLHGLVKKCLIVSTTNEEKLKLSFHPLIRSFAAAKGQKEMKEIVCEAKARFLSHYVSLFKDLNQEFLAGNSLSAFLKFQFEKENIFHSLVEGISYETVRDAIFDVLSTADLFLDTIVYFDYGSVFDNIYDSATTKAKQRHNVLATHQLLLGRAFTEITWCEDGITSQLLKEAEQLEKENPSIIFSHAKGKRMCYYGIYLLINGAMNEGSKILERGISLLSSENTILRALSYKILAVCFEFTSDVEKATRFHVLASTECKNRRDLHVFFLAIEEVARTEEEKSKAPVSHSQPLVLAITLLVSCLARKYRMNNILQRLGAIVYQMQDEIEVKAKCDRLYFPLLYYIARTLVKVEKHEDAFRSLERAVDMSLKQYDEKEEQAAKILHGIGIEKQKMKDYAAALKSHNEALDIRLKLYGDEHPDTAASYSSIAVTQGAAKDYDLALQSYQQALNIRLKLYGDQHPDTANSYYGIGVTQHAMKKYGLALQSHQQALNIRLKLYGDEHPDTAWSYRKIGVTQYEMEDYDSALQSHQQAFNIGLKLYGEEHPWVDACKTYITMTERYVDQRGFSLNNCLLS